MAKLFHFKEHTIPAAASVDAPSAVTSFELNEMSIPVHGLIPLFQKARSCGVSRRMIAIKSGTSVKAWVVRKEATDA